MRKSKIRRRERIYNTIKKKNERANNARNYVYTYGRGYYVQNERCEGRKVPYHRDEFTYINSYTGHKVTIPAYDGIRKEYEWIPIKPIIRRVHIPKKYWKKVACKTVRRNTNITNNGNYKKYFDLDWNIT